MARIYLIICIIRTIRVKDLWRKKMETIQSLAAKEQDQVHITDIKVFQLKGHGIQSIIRVETDAGVWGIGEAGLPAIIVQGYIDFMREWLVGQDALAIEKCYADMIRMRAQWHAHWTQNPTVSGIDMALWDIAGKVFNRSVSSLLTGRFRDEIQLYVNTAGPQDWRDPIACRDWAQEVKADPNGFKVVKFGFEQMLGRGLAPDASHPGWLSDMLTPTELKIIRQGYENCREALGWDIDIIIHCHNEWDLPTALGLAEAVAPIKPLWIEDAMPVMYSDSWKALRQSSAVRIATGEKLEHPAEFLQFMANGAIHVIHPDLAFVGGLTGGRKIADLAELYYIPVVTHNVGSFVQLAATAHFGASVRNFVITECRIPQGQLYPEMSEEGIQVKDGKMKVPTGPGLGLTIRPEVMEEIIEGGKW
jgi:L-alanine-DL-glutamate epimerase-like enolase superfamily enzyme